MAFPDVDVKDFTADAARTVKGFDQGSTKLALAHVPVHADGSALVKKEDDASATTDAGIIALVRRTAAPANTSNTDGDLEYLQVQDGYLWVAQPKLLTVSANFTAAGTTPSYTSGEWISDNGTAGSVTKMSFATARGAGRINRVKIRKSDQTVATPTIRLWLWNATFTVAVGNDAAGAQPLADTLGYVDVACTNAGTDDAVGWTNCDLPFVSTNLFGLLQSQSSFTGATSEVWTVELTYQPS